MGTSDHETAEREAPQGRPRLLTPAERAEMEAATLQLYAEFDELLKDRKPRKLRGPAARPEPAKDIA